MNLMQLLGVKSKQTLGGRYQLIQPLGQGGFGHTFLATDLHLPDHPTCVIKQLKPQPDDCLKPKPESSISWGNIPKFPDCWPTLKTVKNFIWPRS